jgi:hypothetical protein
MLHPYSGRSRHLQLLRCIPLILALLPALTAIAAEEPRPSGRLMDGMRESFQGMKQGIMGVTEFFDTTLPGTLEKYNLVLDFSPKFGDMRHREFIRYRLELRYGLSDEWEVFGGLTPFSPNPINSGKDHRWGLGEFRLGIRKDNPRGFAFYDHATFGMEMRVPVGKPPYDLIDGYTHFKPFISASRKLHWPHTTLFTTFSYDRAMQTFSRDRPGWPVIRQHIAQVAPGLLYKPGEYGMFAEYDFRHLDEDIGYRLSHTGRIGPIWDIPLHKSRGWKLPGKWQIELAYKLTKEEGRSIDHGVSARVRVRTTLREVLSSELARPLRR